MSDHLPEGDEAHLLSSGLERMGSVLSAETQAALLVYVRLLGKWNRLYNLSGVREQAKMVSHHLLDSLVIAPFVKGSSVLDVGTGAGLPGIPLALCYPERQFVLLDSRGKKVRFVRQAVIELGLKNIEVQYLRMEAYHPARQFDTVISRAFSTLQEFVQATGRVCLPTGQLLAMKGRYPDKELKAVGGSYRVADVRALEVPGINAERHLVTLRRGNKIT